MAKLNLSFYKNKDVYSDGDIESTILNIVKNQTEYTEILHSREEWAIMYHLSPVRQNLLSWYDFDKNSSLLEIGGGCGAFSGFFSSKVNNVKVIELSKRRAEIIYNRHKKYNNLEIMVGNLNDVKIDEKFDYITLIGVLEYAGKFTTGKSPFSDFLNNVKGYLKPNGKILIAIENKFGLKYWAGAKEDHTGRYFDGIEDYSNYNGVKTFGKHELKELFCNVGLKKLKFYYPMPDYKLPQVIYSDEYLPDIDNLFDIYSPNYDQDRLVLFDERKAYTNIIRNNSFPFFANSFLVEAKA